MTRGNNVRLAVSDIILDTQNLVTYKVIRIVGNRRIEVMDVSDKTKKILETDTISRGIASGLIKRVTFPSDN